MDAEKAKELVMLISNMTANGDVVDGEKFYMTCDDAIMTLNELIASARQIQYAAGSATGT